jgi:molybdopterin-guanine dinucleotide biosynthesis protein B
LQARGLRVGSIKHSAHPHSLDREGSDSWRHRAAGAEATIGITAAAISVQLPLPASPAETDALIQREMTGLDLVLIEGWSERRGAKIEVLPADGQGRPREPRCREDGELLAVVLAPGLRPEASVLEAMGLTVPCFHWDEGDAVADLVIAWYATP